MQVRNVPENSEIDDEARWLQVSTTLIDSLMQPAFVKWIEGEEALENSKINEVFHCFTLSISPYWIFPFPESLISISVSEAYEYDK